MAVRVLHNSSHLEGINPAVLGVVRSRAARGIASMPVILHGDSALAGQGINYETTQMMHLNGFQVGGALHVVVNNQIGFTAEASAARSTRYATDLFRGFDIPVWRAHTPEGVMRAARMATRFRARFRTDAVVDVIGFRRYGHNELDEPAFTNPVMYRRVDAMPAPGAAYASTLVAEGVLNKADLEAAEAQTLQHLSDEFALAEPKRHMSHLEPEWAPYVKARTLDEPATGVALADLEKVASVSINTSADLHKTLLRSFVEARRKRIESGSLDWATCEALALGSLLKEGYHVRLTGQGERGASPPPMTTCSRPSRFGPRHLFAPPLHAHVAGQSARGSAAVTAGPLGSGQLLSC